LAIIMDGNGRWATKRGLSRSDGHRAGAENIRRVVDAARAEGIKYLTVYAFSTENWKRPKPEVNFLMALIGEFTRTMLGDMQKNNVRLRTIGRTGDLPLPARVALNHAIEATKDNTGFTLNIALSYGGRAEIVDAVNRLLKEGRKGDLTEAEFARYLYAPDIPDPELLIRAGGEFRLSNFLLWESSYSEIYVTDTLWPDFNADTLRSALEFYAGRDRRFGNIKTK
ncbi:MAG: di-trans,poly-cis-decaprenylcistransferase, partial [Lentisphaeria bacterium]|nr:di-trans,poly-cis-decaprenylcistransferase [Lentisphaeria bacterium]